MAFKKRKLSKKEQKALDKKGHVIESEQNDLTKPEIKTKKKISIPEVIRVKDFAEIAQLPVTEVISELIKNGVLANLNENIDFDTAVIIGEDLGIEVTKGEETDLQSNGTNKTEKLNSKNLCTRPPVVTIMGHVDHGKTTLLDKIREAHVAEGESGGITQHISAYNIEIPDPENKKKTRPITFVDTPGHSAFSAMRSHGASIADIVVLIVAANDGVMPQTIEVIKQSMSQNIPIIVAINKVEMPDADVMKVRQQLSEYEIIGEDWGGKSTIVEISAKNGQGIDQLLEMIILQSDLLELVADPDVPATGIIIESHMHKGAGALAVILVENGTLHIGDPITVGPVYGKVRILEDFQQRAIQSAGPSMPVRVAGFKSLPKFGERLVAFESEKEAKESAKKYLERSSIRKFAAAKTIHSDNQGAKILNIIIKADVNGSLEAIKKSLSEIKHPDIKIKYISEGVGAISESDASMALATGAIIMGFRVAILLPAKKIIEKEKISAVSYDVIYELVDDVKKLLEEILPPIIKETETARGEILAEFRNDKKTVVIGAKITEGTLTDGNTIKIIDENNNELWRGKIESLRREKEKVTSVDAGFEAGIGLPPGAKYSVGDKVVAIKVEEIRQTL